MYHKNTSAFTTLSASYTTFRERVWATTSGQSATTVSQSHRGNGHRKSKGLQNDASPTYRPPSSPVERKKKMKLFRAAFTNKIIDVTHRLESILALKRLSVYTLFLVFHRFGTVYSFETCSHTAFENLGKCKLLQLWGSFYRHTTELNSLMFNIRLLNLLQYKPSTTSKKWKQKTKTSFVYEKKLKNCHLTWNVYNRRHFTILLRKTKHTKKGMTTSCP